MFVSDAKFQFFYEISKFLRNTKFNNCVLRSITFHLSNINIALLQIAIIFQIFFTYDKLGLRYKTKNMFDYSKLQKPVVFMMTSIFNLIT